MPPSVDVAMARSLQPGAWEKLSSSVARSVALNLVERDIIGDTQDKITDVKTALSSWDNCMAASFCKYPVIAIIVVGSLILLAILTCIVRCCCCAKSCCCSCFACFKCCGNCCGCCDPPSSRKHKYLDEPYIPPHQGYRTEAPMHATFPPVMGGGVGATPPQYAEFDTGKKGGEDSLPQMPSWEGAGSKKVELEQESVEMNNLNKSPTGTGATEQKDPLMAGTTPTSPMPRENIPSPNPYGRSTPTPAGMVGAQAPSRDPYARNNPYDSQSDGFGLDQPYDLPPAGTPAGGMAAMPGGRSSPGPGRNGYGSRRMDQGYADMPIGPDEQGMNNPYRQTPSPAPPMGGAPGYGMRRGPGDDPYGQRTASPGPGYRGLPPSRIANNSPAPYGMDPRMRNSPGPRSSPRPQGDPYARSPRQTPVSANGPGGFAPPAGSPSMDNFNRSYSPGPNRQYAQSPRPLNQTGAPASPLARQEDAPSSPIVNNGGFDFTSGFSRPQTANSTDYDRRPSESRETPGQEGYPGYKPYRPAQEGWSGV